jgi:hypothetical protein
MVLAFLSFYIWQSASSPVVVASEEDRMTEVVLSAMPQLLDLRGDASQARCSPRGCISSPGRAGPLPLPVQA